jgi:hypothetical protein
MNLFVNETDHWEIPGRGELHSGDRVEFYLNGRWMAALVDYRPKVGYTLRLDNGELFIIHEQMEIRTQIQVKI